MFSFDSRVRSVAALEEKALNFRSMVFKLSVL